MAASLESAQQHPRGIGEGGGGGGGVCPNRGTGTQVCLNLEGVVALLQRYKDGNESTGHTV